MNSHSKTLGHRTAKHLIVISYDAFSEDHWEMASALPNLSRLIGNGVYSTKLRSVYPTLTYTIHSTIVTGVYPDKHGVTHNNPLQPFVHDKEQEWHWYRHSLKVPAIYDAVKEAGMSTAGLLWPVSGKSSIQYNLPEIAAINNENQALKILRNGSPLFCLGLELKYGRYRKGVEQPYLDDFTTLCAADTIKRKKPNLLLMHLIELDDAKHRYGTNSEEVKAAIQRMDQRLGKLIQAVEEAGIQEDTVFLVLGDHGQHDVQYIVRLNLLLQEWGLIFKENGEWNWRAYIQSAGGSAYLHIRDGDEDAEKVAVSALQSAMGNEQYGIERILSREELDRLHVDQSVHYMVEAKIGYCFDDSLAEPTVTDLVKNKIQYATHGYLPNKYGCNIVVSGNMLRSGVPLSDIDMVDIAPTMAEILGVKLGNVDGRARLEIFL